MRKLFYLLIIMGILTIGSTAIAWDFSSFNSYSPPQVTPQTQNFASSTSFSYAPTGFGYGGSFATGCGDCFTLDTWTTSSTYTRDGWNGSISTASAGAYVSTIVCNEPPVCGDIDGDGVCDDSDNCEFIPNTNQSDIDDDQIGDVCDQDTPPPVSECDEDDTECLLEEACPCENDWRNHGAYVTCTVKFRNDHKFDQPPLPDLEHIVSEAGCSDCGGSHRGQGCE